MMIISIPENCLKLIFYKESSISRQSQLQCRLIEGDYEEFLKKNYIYHNQVIEIKIIENNENARQVAFFYAMSKYDEYEKIIKDKYSSQLMKELIPEMYNSLKVFE